MQVSRNLLVYGQPGATWSLLCVLATPLSRWRGVMLRDLGLSLSWAQHTGGPRCPAAASQVVTRCDSWECGVPRGSCLGVAAGLSLSVLRNLCVQISVIIAVHAGCVWSCVCMSFWMLSFAGTFAVCGWQAPWSPFRQDCSPHPHCSAPHPPPCCHQRLCFHPPSTASGTLDFASVAPTEAPSHLLSLGLSSSWPLPVAVRGVQVGCAGPWGAPPFCCRDCLGSAPFQL